MDFVTLIIRNDMNKELETQLVKEFPKIFKDYHGDIRYTGLYFGIECRDGWFNIIRQLCISLDKYDKLIIQATPWYKKLLYKLQGRDIGLGLYVVQVKEKYGTLRFYVNGTNEVVLALIGQACRNSLNTCEECGGYGELRDGSYIRTLCDKHAMEQKDETSIN